MGDSEFWPIGRKVGKMWHTPIKVNMLYELIESSPVPVKFVGTMNTSDVCGTYFHFSKSEMGKARIEIDNQLSDGLKIGTLIHEIGHAVCGAKGCECLENPDHAEREIHTNKFLLKWLLKHKQKKILKMEIKSIIRQANGNACRKYYDKAAKHTMGLKLWQKCLDYIK